MFKKLFVIMLLVVFLFSTFIIYNHYANKQNIISTENNVHNELEEIKEESSKQEQIPLEEIEIEVSTPETSIQTEEIKKDTPTKKEESNNANSFNKNTITENKNIDIQNTEKETEKIIVEENKTTNIWDELGISEYDYYYSPMWKWQDIKFGIYIDNEYKCNDMNDCRNKCINYGELLLETKNGGYTCNEVYSHSNNYLGEQFIFKNLEQ